MKRQQVIDALKTELLNISTANGFYTDMQTVDDWRQTGFEKTELPALNIRDVEDRTGENDETEHDLTVDIGGITAPGSDSPAQVRELLADILKAVKNFFQNNQSLISGVIYTDSTIDVSHDKNKLSAVSVGIHITYYAELFEI